MPWCPKCRLEYREGFENCNDCGVPLVDELPPEEPAPTFEPEDTPVFLVSSADGFEADILAAKLEAFGVPVMKRHKETGDYLKIYMGASPFGIDLYVPSQQLEKARDILENIPEVSEDGEGETEEELQEELREEQEMGEALEKRKERSSFWLFLLIGVPALIYLLFRLFTGK